MKQIIKVEVKITNFEVLIFIQVLKNTWEALNFATRDRVGKDLNNLFLVALAHIKKNVANSYLLVSDLEKSFKN